MILSFVVGDSAFIERKEDEASTHKGRERRGERGRVKREALKKEKCQEKKD